MIAMEAALSGHLVLSTLHTNTAAATPLRSPKWESSRSSSRRPSAACSPNDSPASSAPSASRCPCVGLRLHWRRIPRGRSGGCRHIGALSCRRLSSMRGNGYYGRMVLAEVMKMTEEINRLIITGGSIGDIGADSISQG